MNWWNPFKRRQQIEVIKRDRCLMRLTEWQSNPSLVKLAQTHLSNPEIRLMLDVLITEHPGGMVYADGASHDVRVVAQARSEGYTLCLANLEALGKFVQQKEPIEETFGAVEPPES